MSSNFIKIVIFFLSGLLLSFILPFLLDLFLLAAIVTVMYAKKIRKAYIISILIGYSMRIIIVLILLGIIWRNPQYIPKVYRNTTISLLIFGSDFGLFEGITRHYSEEIKRGDPFSGQPYRMINDNFYSIGPDGKDDRLRIIYDPTNGTYSAGDIKIPVIKRVQSH